MLRSATRALHEAVERTAPMAGLMATRPDRAAIATVVRRLAALHGEMEAAMMAAQPPVLAAHGCYVARAPLLRADCLALGAAPPPDAAGQGCQDAAPVPVGSAGWAGWLYVVEGASLGGAVIGRHLALSRPDLPKLHGFDPYGAARGRVWRRFSTLLESHLATDEARQQAVLAARRGFAAILRLMAKPAA